MKLTSKYKYLILFLIFIYGVQNIIYGTEVQVLDSLKTLLSDSKPDTAKVNLLLKIVDETSWSDVKLSDKYAKQALNLSEELNYPRGLALSKLKLSEIYKDYDFELTEQLTFEGLKIAEELNDSLLIARMYNAIGNLKANLYETEDALSYYFKALTIFENNSYDSYAAGVYNNLGLMYINAENDSLSEVYFLKAIETNLRTENLLWLTFNYINISRMYLETGTLDKAYSYLTKSLKLAEENEFSRLLPWIYNFFGKYYYSIKDYNKSLDNTHFGLNASIEQVNRMQERVALIQLMDVYNEINDFENAFKYSKLIVAVNDSINRHNKLRELDLLEMRYKFEEEQKARKLEQALLKAKHYRKELIYVLVILGSGITLLTFVFLFISQRNRTRRKTLEQKNTLLEKEKLAKDLELRNKELTSNAMSLMKKNEVLSDIAGQLMDLRASAVKDETKFAIKKIVKELQKSKDSEIWKEFDMRFKQVHNDFYNKLIERFPDLTPTEQRLCAFLRLNMTSKEISELTGQRTGTIEMARSKVRKKLGIAHDQTNLITFLAKI